MRTEVAIVGGGPAGAATAIFLAQQGIPSTIIEKETFPRFHIGESMTGECGNVARLLGLEGELAEARSPIKYGVKVFGPGGKNAFWVPVMARMEGGGLSDAFTWQVRRSSFDSSLLERARSLPEVSYLNGQALDVVRGEEGTVAGVVVRSPEGRQHRIDARVVVDASGLHTFLSNVGVVGGKERGRYDRQLAIFSHVKGATRDPGKDSGNTLIFYRDKNHWAWFIPIDDEVTSIGITVPSDYYRDKGEDRFDFYRRELEELNDELSWRVKDVTFVEEARGITNYSYHIRDFTGPGYLCVGDSHRFIDPIFSFGLHFALSEAQQAAPAIAAFLNGETSHLPDPFAAYAHRVDSGQDLIQDLIDAFWDHPLAFAFFVHKRYREDFIDLFAGRIYDEEIKPGSLAIKKILQKAPHSV